MMLNNTLSLYDLITSLEELREEHGDDILVVASSDYGDMTHTEQLIEIGEPELCVPVKTAYSCSGYAFPDEEEDDEFMDDDDYREEPQKVIVLRMV